MPVARRGLASPANYRGVDLRVLAAANGAAPAQGDMFGCAGAVPALQQRDAERVPWPDRRIAVPAGNLRDRRQPPVLDGEGPQVRGVALGRVVGLPGDVGDAGTRAGRLHVVDGVVLVRRDADRGGPGPAAIGGIREPADVTVARGGLGIPGGVEVPGPVRTQVAVDPPFGVREGAYAAADLDGGRPRLAAVGGTGEQLMPGMYGERSRIERVVNH